jgi:hypothetical protein
MRRALLGIAFLAMGHAEAGANDFEQVWTCSLNPG